MSILFGEGDYIVLTHIKDEVFLGNHENYNKLLRQVAEYAQEEIWTYGSYKMKDPYRILRSYLEYTYDIINAQNKFVYSKDGKYKCMNTGLLTEYNQDILLVFAKNSYENSGFPWRLTRVCKETDTFINEKFSNVPEIADYFNNITDLVYDKNLPIQLNIDHIIDDNYTRFSSIGYSGKQTINALLNASLGLLQKKLKRNFKLALPFYYNNTNTGIGKIQLLVPVYFPNSPVRLSLVLDKRENSEGEHYYEGITVLPIEWAYMNSRLIVRPDDEWVRIIEEIPDDSEEMTIKDESIDESCDLYPFKSCKA